MIVRNLGFPCNFIFCFLRWPGGHFFNCSLCQFRSKKHTAKSRNAVFARQSNLMGAPSSQWAFYGRRTRQLGTMGGHTCILACGSFAVDSAVCAMVAPDSAAGRSVVSGLFASCHRGAGICFFRGDFSSFPRHTGPHLTHLRGRISVVWGGVGRFQRAIFSASHRASTANPLGAGSLMGGAINSGVTAGSSAAGGTFSTAFAPSEDRNRGRFAERGGAHVLGDSRASEITDGSIAISGRSAPFAPAVVSGCNFSNCGHLVSPQTQQRIYGL